MTTANRILPCILILLGACLPARGAAEAAAKPRRPNVVVFFVDDMAQVSLEDIGPTIENDAAFPERINVNVAAVGPDAIRLRTWERGAGATLACGTGACATAVAAIRSKRAASPVTVSMPGGVLSIAWAPGEPIRMRGAATHVFEGELDLEAFA